MQPVNTDYGGKLIDEVSRVLKQRADSAQLAGIPRWNIILDPGMSGHFLCTCRASAHTYALGIGFAKTAEHNLEILRRLKELRRNVRLWSCLT